MSKLSKAQRRKARAESRAKLQNLHNPNYGIYKTLESTRP